MVTATDARGDARAMLTTDIAGIAAGDRDALRRVYDATSAKLFGVCRRILPDGAEAEDALQDAYIKVWRNAGRFDPSRASPITWLCAIARNTALDARRAGSRGDAALDAIAGGATPDHPVQAMLDQALPESQALEHCLETLEASHQRAIVAAFYEGFSYSELAAQRNVPLGTMKSWIRRGLATLKRCLDDD